MSSLQVDAILFDMDGTLVDESVSYREAIRLTAEYILGYGVSTEEVAWLKDIPGFNNDWDATWGLIVSKLHGAAQLPSEADRASQAYGRMRDVFQTYYLGDSLWSRISVSEAPFAWDEPLIAREAPLISRETLQALSKFMLGIATSRPRTEAMMAVRQHGFDRFFDESAIVAAEDAPFEKPHPAPLEELVRRLRCKRPVYVGDTINDALAAHAAGIPFIAVGTVAFDTEAAHDRLRTVDEIVELCAPLEQEVHG